MAAMDGTKPDLENGYTRIANGIMEALAGVDLTQREWRVLFIILRETYGFQRKAARLSLGYIAAKTGFYKQHVGSAVLRLESRGMLLVDRSASPFLYQFQKYRSRWIAVTDRSDAVTGRSDAVTVTDTGDTLSPKPVTPRHRSRLRCTQVHERNLHKETMKETMGANAPPDVQFLFRAYTETYQEIHGRKPVLNAGRNGGGGKDGAAFQQLLTEHSAEDVERWLRSYVASGNEFYKRRGWCLATFFSEINAIIEACDGDNGAEPPPGESEECKRTREYLREREKYGKPKTRSDTAAES